MSNLIPILILGVFAGAVVGFNRMFDDPAAWASFTNLAYGTDPEQVMDIFVPRGNGQHPTIVLIHGGGWGRGDKQNLAAIARMLAGDGFTVANINYRLVTETANHYPAAVEDARAAVAFLKSSPAEYKVDSKRIAAFGTSAGGNIALELGLSRSVKAVADFYGPTDFTDSASLSGSYDGIPNSEIMSIYLGATPAQNPTLYRDASPIEMVTAQMPPTIIFHGDSDNIVPVSQSIRFHEKLVQLKVVTELHIIPNAPHGFLNSTRHSPVPVLLQCEKFLRANMP